MANPRKKAISPTHVRKSCLAHSTKKEAPIFPESTMSKLERMLERLSPDSQYTFRSRCRKTLVQLDDKAKQDEVKAHRELFKNAASLSAHHASPPKKKANNKGQVVTPYLPDCGLSPDDPGRNGRRGSRCLLVDVTPPSKKKKVEKVD